MILQNNSKEHSLRTHESVEQSEITKQPVEIRDILELFYQIQGIIFLRNIETCSLYHIKEQKQFPQLIWQAQIKMLETCCKIHQSVINETQIYKLDLEGLIYENE